MASNYRDEKEINSQQQQMSSDLLDWCSQIQILRNIRVNLFCDNFSDGVLFLHLVQHLLPETTNDIRDLTRTVYAAENFFDKLDNWKKINDVILKKYDLMRSEWFLTYLAKGKEGYIQDLLEDLKKTVPEPRPPVSYYNSYEYENPDPDFNSYESRSFDQNHQNADAAISFAELESRQMEMEDNHDNDYDNRRRQVVNRYDGDGAYDEVTVTHYPTRPPQSSYYMTPLNDEPSYENRSRGRDLKSRLGVRRNYNRRGRDDASQRDGGNYQDQRLRWIQRKGNFSFYRRKTWPKSFIRYRTYDNNRPEYNRNFSYQKQRNRNNQRWKEPRVIHSRVTVPLVSLEDEEEAKPQQKQQGRNAGSVQQNTPKQAHQYTDDNESEYLNQRFNYYQNRGSEFNDQQIRYSKYFYRYYLQYPVSCNSCIDNNLVCRCPRYGLDSYFQGAQIR